MPRKKKEIEFRLRDHVEDTTIYHVMTTLPLTAYIDKLWSIAQTVGNDISECFKSIYSQVTQRNGSGEGKPHYFMHVGSTTVYEAVTGQLIKGKNHGIKAGNILQRLQSTLKKLEAVLNEKQYENKDQKKLLRRFKAALNAQHNALVFSLKTLPEKTKEHLRKHQNLNIDSIQTIDLKERHLKYIVELHPEPVPVTPKKPSPQDNKTKMALLATNPPDDSQSTESKGTGMKARKLNFDHA